MRLRRLHGHGNTAALRADPVRSADSEQDSHGPLGLPSIWPVQPCSASDAGNYIQDMCWWLTAMALPLKLPLSKPVHPSKQAPEITCRRRAQASAVSSSALRRLERLLTTIPPQQARPRRRTRWRAPHPTIVR